MTLRFPNALVSLCLVGLLCTAVPAAPTHAPAQVVIGGTLIHVIRTSWCGRSPQQRADQVQQRLVPALAQGPITPKDITVAQVQDDWCVLLRGQRFLTADGTAAEQQHLTPEALATMWAAHLRLVLPELTQIKGK